MIRALIVGGAAHLGAHLVEALLRGPEPIAITVMDLRPYAGPRAEQVVSVLGDLTAADDCARVLGSGSFDVVFSMVTPNLRKATAEEFERVNVDGIRTLVGACRHGEVRALVYVSSIAVLDHFRDHIDVDETEPLPPIEQYRSPYDRSKRLGEQLILAADRPGALRTCSLRMGGILSSMSDITLSSLTASVVLTQNESKPIDMIYGGDAAFALVLAMQGLLERPDEVGGEPFFITKGRAIRSFEYATWVADRLGRRVVVLRPLVRALIMRGSRLSVGLARRLGRPVPGIPIHDFLNITDFQQTFDNSKAERILGYTSQTVVEDGLTRILDEYLQQQGGAGRR